LTIAPSASPRPALFPPISRRPPPWQRPRATTSLLATASPYALLRTGTRTRSSKSTGATTSPAPAGASSMTAGGGLRSTSAAEEPPGWPAPTWLNGNSTSRTRQPHRHRGSHPTGGQPPVAVQQRRSTRWGHPGSCAGVPHRPTWPTATQASCSVTGTLDASGHNEQDLRGSSTLPSRPAPPRRGFPRAARDPPGDLLPIHIRDHPAQLTLVLLIDGVADNLHQDQLLPLGWDQAT
jgi:hypothetical protein